jgi:hypothetical protein
MGFSFPRGLRSGAFGAGSTFGTVRFGIGVDLFQSFIRLLDQLMQIGVGHFHGGIGGDIPVSGSFTGKGIVPGMTFTTVALFGWPDIVIVSHFCLPLVVFTFLDASRSFLSNTQPVHSAQMVRRNLGKAVYWRYRHRRRVAKITRSTCGFPYLRFEERSADKEATAMDIGQAVPPGIIVYGADGEPIGTVESSDDTTVMVEAEDSIATFSIPVSAIVESREDGVYLSVTRDDALRQGWGQTPEEGPDRIVEEGNSGYSAIQAEDSVRDEYAAMPVEGEAGVGSGRALGTEKSIERPSGETGPDTSGSR